MSLDVLNYDRVRSGSYLVSSDYAVFSVGGEGADVARALVQNANIQYQQRVELRPEAGSHEMYLVTGQASGSANMSRLIGQGGLMHKIQPGGNGTLNKGRIGILELDVSSATTSSPGSTQAGLEFSSVLSMSGAALRGISWGVNVGALEISETLDIIFTTLQQETN